MIEQSRPDELALEAQKLRGMGHIEDQTSRSKNGHQDRHQNECSKAGFHQPSEAWFLNNVLLFQR